jgi:hypothetical protein
VTTFSRHQYDTPIKSIGYVVILAIKKALLINSATSQHFANLGIVISQAQFGIN